MDTLTQPLLLSLPPVEWVEDVPILYEDEEEGDRGEANLHVVSDELLHVCLCAHFADRPGYQVYSNMNLYYRDRPLHPTTGSMPYVSPDTMVVQPYVPLPAEIRSYKIGKDGPAPVAIVEILSERSYQQRDLKEKITLYAQLGVREYLLVDVTARYLPARLLLKRLNSNGSWTDCSDADGGITSQLGFRIIFDTDGGLRVADSQTGRKYVRPMEAETLVQELHQAEEAQRKAEDERQQAEERFRQEEESRRQLEAKLRALEAELARLRKKGK